MMLFGEWIKTQDPALWELDEATIAAVTNHYAYREICSDKRMALYFWRTLDHARDRYKDMLRLELMNANIDPAVNRYFEELDRHESDGTHEFTSHTGTHSDTYQGATKTYLGPDMENYTWCETDKPGTTEKLSFDGRRHERTFSGSKIETDEGEPNENYTEDGVGSKEVTYHNVKSKRTTSRKGKFVVEDDSMDATTARQASKVPPMSAVNLPRQTVEEGPRWVDKVTNGQLGQLDFSYASQYGENDGTAGHSARHTERYEGDENGVVTLSEGDTDQNKDETQFKRKQMTAVHRTKKTNYGPGYKESEEEVGSESRTKSGTDSKNGCHTNTITHAGEKTDASARETGSSDGTQHGEEINVALRKYRTAGRVGLTPQEGLEAAIKYLQTMPESIEWLIQKLAVNFIGVFDPDEDWEV